MLERLRSVGLLTALAVVGIGTVFTVVKATGAESERQVQFSVRRQSSPMVIWKVTEGDTAVQLGRFASRIGELPGPITPFRAGDDWVRNMTVYFVNRTNRTIVYATMVIDFPETTVIKERKGIEINLGRIPVGTDLNGVPVRQPPDTKPLQFGPGQIYALHLEDYMSQFHASVGDDRELASLTVLGINPGRLFFSDGMQFNGGFHSYDPAKSVWTLMDRNFFPGDMDSIWPGRPGWVDGR